MKFTAKQYEQIGVAIRDARHTAPTFQAEMEDSGRAAVAAVAPLLLAEPERGATDEAHEAAMRMRTCEGTFKGGWRACVRYYSNRLASVTAKPDPAVEAVEALPELNGWSEQARKSAAERIVAVVDAARAK